MKAPEEAAGTHADDRALLYGAAMPIEKVFAHLSCHELERSIPWFTALFDRPPDARPMNGLAEWHQNAQAGFQLFESPSNAGHGTLTRSVDNLEAERSRLEKRGLSAGPIEPADYVDIVRMRDPDENLVVLAKERQ